MIGIVRRARTRRAEAQRLQRQRPRCGACTVGLGSPIALDACRMVSHVANFRTAWRTAHRSATIGRCLAHFLGVMTQAVLAGPPLPHGWQALVTQDGRNAVYYLSVFLSLQLHSAARSEIDHSQRHSRNPHSQVTRKPARARGSALWCAAPCGDLVEAGKRA